jgi:hypothetical protein
MSSDLSHFESPSQLGQLVITSVDRFLNQHPTGNNKNWNDLKARLSRLLQGTEATLAFDGLLWILENHNGCQHQMVAGELLQRASLVSTLPLKELLRRLLPNFEESARTVPAYIRWVFGKEAVLLTLDELENATVDPLPVGKIKTMRYWMEAPQDSPGLRNNQKGTHGNP